jgi:hypothetical protein
MVTSPQTPKFNLKTFTAFRDDTPGHIDGHTLPYMHALSAKNINGQKINGQGLNSAVETVPHKSEPTYQHAMTTFCILMNSFSGSLLTAAAACYCGGSHVKWDTLHYNIFLF